MCGISLFNSGTIRKVYKQKQNSLVSMEAAAGNAENFGNAKHIHTFTYMYKIACRESNIFIQKTVHVCERDNVQHILRRIQVY